MRFALVDGQRLEARPALAGECQTCGSPVLARCGEIKVWHWAHQRSRVCDKWWESETEWHRTWKSHFPDDWQEVVQFADSGEKHIADVKTPAGWVIEFQHSHIDPQERRARNDFYGKLIWIVDATRRKRDRPQLLRSWEASRPVGSGAVRRIWPDDCALVKEWAGTSAPTFFDAGDDDSLWWLLKADRDKWAYMAKLPRAQFLHIHREQKDGGFDQFVKELSGLVAGYESSTRAVTGAQPSLRFGSYPAPTRRVRRF